MGSLAFMSVRYFVFHVFRILMQAIQQWSPGVLRSRTKRM